MLEFRLIKIGVGHGRPPLFSEDARAWLGGWEGYRGAGIERVVALAGLDQAGSGYGSFDGLR